MTFKVVFLDSESRATASAPSLQPMYLETESLSKQYRSVRALDECTLAVEQGEIFGLLGPNGAGKTTLLRLLMGFLKPTSGGARIAGLDCYHQSLQVRQHVSYLPGDVRLFRQMRGRDVLRFLAEVRRGGDFRRSLSLAERLELELARRVAYMSTGMRQKLALVATLSSHTPLLILDEPTSNLDPTVRSTVIDLVREARADGRTVMFSSHVLSEVEEACDRVVILREGKLVHTQVMSELRLKHRILARLNGPLPELPLELNGRIAIWARNDEDVLIETPGELAPLLGWLSTLPLAEVKIEPVGLRDVYDRYHRFGRDMVHAESRLPETTTR